MSIFDSTGFGSGDPDNTTPSSFNTGGLQAGVGLGIGAIGLGLEGYGTYEKVQAEKAYTASNIAIAGLEEQQDTQRQLAMQINSRRQMTEQIRQAQQRSSYALAAGVGQTGSAQGTGIAGARAQATGEAAYNLQGISQNTEIGNNLFALSSQISQQRIAGFQAQSNAYTAGGISSFGGDLMQAAPLIAKFAAFL